MLTLSENVQYGSASKDRNKVPRALVEYNYAVRAVCLVLGYTLS